ncbi:MAG TPA: TetR/AcrR family transcriptional regulator [Candidatus Elarobacter sp.]|jgi:AcrR family transcriptional regulator|nr:TetR/AcrR family transcriptional regulator [Candidatus Elarobacter sp.]
MAAARRPRRTRLSPDERERLIARGAVAFFCEVGFGGQTRELAKRLGITQPLLYRYFPNKEALIDRVYQEVYLNRWDPRWEELLDDHTRPARERVVAFYREYAKAVLSYEWIRVFMFSGLRGMNLNSRYLTLVRDRIYTRVIREVRLAYGMPSPAQAPITEMEFELVWALHASIFYIGIRKWIYGLEIPENVDDVVTSLATSFFDGVPAVIAKTLRPAKTTAAPPRKTGNGRGTNARSRRG